MPVEVLGITDATQITTGDGHTCALRQTGTIKCWGRNDDGQLGNATKTNSSVPVEVLGITDAAQITAGVGNFATGHTCALRRTGAIACWGNNDFGQLGNGAQTGSSAPVVEVLGITDATQITASSRHTCALRQTGTIKCWGRNSFGQLGNGQSGEDSDSDADSSVPVEVTGIIDAAQITASEQHTCALRQTGTITCWGNNDDGQLGNGTISYDEYPVPAVVLGITDATQITASGGTDATGHTCALRRTGTITCWGNNRSGQLGNATKTNSPVPVEVTGITDAAQITAGRDHTCALRQTGTITCWGNNDDGQLGNGTETRSFVPVEVTGIIDAAQITASEEHTCALRRTGTITCWGNNRSGQLGNGTETRSFVPVEVTGIIDAAQITAGSQHTCALRRTGTITCWGNNEYGQLGNGTISYDEYPVPAVVLGITDATQITAGSQHTCALRQTGTITCWGRNSFGQLGNGTTRSSGVPVEVTGITDAAQITTSGSHTCALRQTGTITCWGDNRSGQLGNGQSGDDWQDNSAYSSVPVEVTGIIDAAQITAGSQHTCALRRTGTITCWGNNEYGQLGNGTISYDEYPVPAVVLGITDATQITAGSQHTCALRQTGTITCWGSNRYGQLGNGTTDSSSVPIEVLGITDATQITTSGSHTCALRQTGTITCWGNNWTGQLGNGAFLPQDVVGFGG